MRVTINHREERSLLGKIEFYVDCIVQFSEAEKAVIRNRQLGHFFLETDSDIPTFRGVREVGWFQVALRLGSRASLILFFLSMFAVPILGIHDGIFWFFLILTVGLFAYRKWGEKQFKDSIKPRYITMTELLKNSKFTVYAPDAFNAQEREKSLVAQLADFKQKMIAVAPGLAEKQVYDYGR